MKPFFSSILDWVVTNDGSTWSIFDTTFTGHALSLIQIGQSHQDHPLRAADAEGLSPRNSESPGDAR
jgi:hypothetical protein